MIVNDLPVSIRDGDGFPYNIHGVICKFTPTREDDLRDEMKPLVGKDVMITSYAGTNGSDSTYPKRDDGEHYRSF